MLPQEAMIARLRQVCAEDADVDAAMMYGSFTRGEGDAYSDIEFLLFFREDALPTLDRRAWLSQIRPVEMLFRNEFGHHVAIFDNLVRGEFHFHTTQEVAIAEAWPGVVHFPTLASTLIVDKSGRLAPYLEPLIGPAPVQDTPPQVQALADGFINWTWFGINVLRRGEYARALDVLGAAQRHLLWMARVLAGKTDNWHIPSKAAERELGADVMARFRACTASTDPGALWAAYRALWAWGGEMLDALAARYAIDTHAALRRRMSAQVAAQGSSDGGA